MTELPPWERPGAEPTAEQVEGWDRMAAQTHQRYLDWAARRPDNGPARDAEPEAG